MRIPHRRRRASCPARLLVTLSLGNKLLDFQSYYVHSDKHKKKSRNIQLAPFLLKRFCLHENTLIISPEQVYKRFGDYSIVKPVPTPSDGDVSDIIRLFHLNLQNTWIFACLQIASEQKGLVIY